MPVRGHFLFVKDDGLDVAIGTSRHSRHVRDLVAIIAGAIAAKPFVDLLKRQNSQHVTIAVLAGYILWGHAQSAIKVYGKHDKVEKICVVVTIFTSRVSFPYCNPRT
jgi:hypothetical protein